MRSLNARDQKSMTLRGTFNLAPSFLPERAPLELGDPIHSANPLNSREVKGPRLHVVGFSSSVQTPIAKLTHDLATAT